MRNLILVALVLQLVLILTQAKKDFKFGDLISMKRKCKICPLITYKHYAIYVGHGTFLNKKDEQNIFHRTGPRGATGDCKFGHIEDEEGKIEIERSLDEKFPLDKEHFTDVVKERIEHWLNQDFCGTYDIATNNCEHLAMHVRYGHKMSKQDDTTAKWICKLIPNPKKRDTTCPEYEKLVAEIEKNAKAESDCLTSKC